MIFISTEHKRQHCIEQHIKPSFGPCSHCGRNAARRREFYAYIINEHIVHEELEK